MQSMDEIYRSYSVPLYRYLKILTRSEDLAEELTQETFCEAIRCIDRYDGSCQMLTWLCQIAKHKWYDILKRQNRRQATDSALRNNYISAEELPAHVVERQDEAERLYCRIQALPQESREILLLRLSAELSFRQIGEITGLSENAARVKYYRIRKQLAEQLTGEGEE